MPASRERLLTATFVELADTLIDDFDVIELLNRLAGRCLQLLDVTAAGLMLADSTGSLQATAASSEKAALVGLLELQNEEGPCLDCFHAGAPLVNVDLDTAALRWPRFAPRAVELGYTLVHALPLRLRDEAIGVLNLLAARGGELDDDALALAQALADAATISILQQRTVEHHVLLTGQLETALHSRVLVEQAKGVLAERWHVSPDQAFGPLRRYARSRRRLLSAVARDVIDGTLDTDTLR